MDGGGVFQVAQELAAAPARDVAPRERGIRVDGRGAPALAGQAGGGAVAAGEQHQPAVAGDEAPRGTDSLTRRPLHRRASLRRVERQ